MRINLRKNNGITLIALIVTIIILIILAGISIGTLTGDNGIIKQAQTAKTETERSDIEEKINVIVIDNSKEREMDKDKLISDFENKLPDGKEIVDSDNLIYIIYPEYSFEVDIETGDVKQTEIERVEDETPWELAGSGTEEDPYLIESIEDLVAFSNSVNNGNDYRSKYIKLTTDLDFNLPFSYDNPKTKVSEKTNRIIEEDSNGTEIKEFLTSGTGFNPIGIAYNNNMFYGNFDGNGKEIKNIYINRPDEDYVGLFACMSNGTIEKLGLKRGEIIGNNFVGGISGEDLGNIKFCYNSSNIKGNENIGGITGYTYKKEINFCYNNGKIVGNQSVGGIIGWNNSSIIKNTFNTGTIEGKKWRTGGIVGDLQGDICENLYNLGNIQESGSSDSVGGIVGSGYGNHKKLYNSGYISNVNGKFGGLFGMHGYADTMLIFEESYYQKGTAISAVSNKTDKEVNAGMLEESEMPSVISVVMTDSEKVEWNGEMVDVWKEDTNNINNGYPILFWQ